MNNKAHLRPKDFDSNGDIIPMGCKEEKGDLISRSELRQKMEFVCMDILAGRKPYVAPLAEIDNAPTVPLPDFIEGYKQAILDGKTNYARPTGEWKINLTTGDIFCSCCKEVRRDTRINHINFCNSCGADMRKGGAE